MQYFPMLHIVLSLTAVTSFNKPQYFDGSSFVRTSTAVAYDKLIKTWTQ
jgi:hypothetical protein